MISSNIGEVMSVFLFSFLGLPDGFNSIQLLLINLITDGFPAMALSFNPADEDIMLKPPRSKDDGIVDAWVLIRYFSIGIYVGAASVGIFVYWYVFYSWASDGHPLVTMNQLINWVECSTWPREKFDLSASQSDAFPYLKDNPCLYFTEGKKMPCTLTITLVIVMEMLNCWNALSENTSLMKTGLTSNKFMLPVTVCCLLFHLLLLYVPALNFLFSLKPLDLKVAIFNL